MNGRKILVVDDEKVICELVARLLVQNGYETACAHSMNEALAILDRGEPVGVILSDVRMPGGTGLDLLERVRARKSPLPVVLMTAFADVTREQAIARGAVGLIPKPFDPQSLITLLKSISG